MLWTPSTNHFPADLPPSTFIHNLHLVYSHPMRHVAPLRGLSVFETSTSQTKWHSLKIATFIKQPKWALEFQLTSLLARCGSRKEIEKRLQTSVWKAVTTNGSFTLSALTSPSGSNQHQANACIHLEHTAGRTHFPPLPYLSPINSFHRTLGVFHTHFRSPHVNILSFLLLQHLCARTQPHHLPPGTLLSSSLPSDSSQAVRVAAMRSEFTTQTS